MLLADIMKKKEFVFGDELARFQESLASYVGAKYAWGVGSGTDALIYSLKALGVGHGDEVIVPAMSFPSTAFAVAWVGATPIFVDIELKNFHIDVEKIEEKITSKTKVIMPVHLHGFLSDMGRISTIAAKHKVRVIEDAAQAIGASRYGLVPGMLSDAACYSFSPTKILRCFGDGGAIVTNNEELSERVRLLRCYGAKLGRVYFHHEIVGISSRLDNFQAGVMNIFMSELNEMISRQKRNWLTYLDKLKDVGDIVSPEYDSENEGNGYRFVLRTKARDSLKKFLESKKIRVKINYPVPMPYLKALEYLGHSRGEFPNAELVSREILSLPTDYWLSEKDIHKNVEYIKDFLLHRWIA